MASSQRSTIETGVTGNLRTVNVLVPNPPAREETHEAADLNALYRLAGYKALVQRAMDVFGDENKASRWLSRPNRDLNDRSPIEAAREVSYDPARVQAIFEPIFTIIEHGIYT